MKPMSLSACSVDDNRPARTSITVTQACRARQRVEDLHLVGNRGDVHDFGHVGMEALERAARRLGIEGARRHLMGAEIVEQGAGDRRLADASFVGTDENDCWFGHANIL